ncbi:hypothetical protein GCM10025876_31290 [Demequina litorisediminis]|uniref:DNA 3'-5' helicase n=2 Tax=Demequina litorisediminis TaxID=1849022 RepID=A0ABQ6IG99_9MICO|nr:hypothetical protein GCM10025876_31290 [Demequina litorisediminis]
MLRLDAVEDVLNVAAGREVAGEHAVTRAGEGGGDGIGRLGAEVDEDHGGAARRDKVGERGADAPAAARDDDDAVVAGPALAGVGCGWRLCHGISSLRRDRSDASDPGRAGVSGRAPRVVRMAETDGLNAAQAAAVETGASHNLILAGAGTGKTTTIVARIRHLIRNGTAPERILALTFTRRAAAEIRSRVQTDLSQRAGSVAAMTFHAWAMREVRTSPDVFGYDGWSVLDQDDTTQVMRGVLGRGKRVEGLKAAQILDVLSFALNTRRTLAEAIRVKFPDDAIDAKAVGAAVRAFEERKQERKYLTYDDILRVFAARLRDDAVAAWVGSHYDEVLIDEMQDTNPLQWQIIDPLVPHTRFYCVGDDAQSIYGFRGADFASIHSFGDRVPGASVLRLEDNYRSTQEILDLANWLLAESPLDYQKRLRAVRGRGLKPELHSFETPQDEAGWIVSEMLRARADEPVVDPPHPGALELLGPCHRGAAGRERDPLRVLRRREGCWSRRMCATCCPRCAWSRTPTTRWPGCGFSPWCRAWVT